MDAACEVHGYFCVLGEAALLVDTSSGARVTQVSITANLPF